MKRTRSTTPQIQREGYRLLNIARVSLFYGLKPQLCVNKRKLFLGTASNSPVCIRAITPVSSIKPMRISNLLFVIISKD